MALRTKNVMIGRTYTFFLDNGNLPESWYHYQIVSTGLSEDMYPLVTLKKIGERVQQRNFRVVDGSSHMFSSDLISTILGKKNNPEKASMKFFQEQILGGLEGSHNIFLKKYPPEVVGDPEELPSWEILPGSENYLTKLAILELRDKLRWARYKFTPGNFVDILVSPTKFGVLEIKGTRDSIWVEPVGLYSNDDCNMQSPLNGTFHYPQTKFEGDTKASALNRALRKFEAKSFIGPELKG